MAGKNIALGIDVAVDSGTAVSGFDDVGAAAKDMANDVKTATSSADQAASANMNSIADSADNLGSSSSQAAGGLGDLGGALSAVPGPLGAVGSGMESLAPLVMGVTGATDLLNLATNSSIVVNTKARIATVANAVATKTMAAVSKVAAVGQWALNAAMAANPIGIVVIAVAALVAGLVLAYNKSETFRNIVDGAMRAAGKAVDFVMDPILDLVDVVKEKAPEAIDKLAPAFDVAKTLIVGYINLITLPIRTVIGLVGDLIDLIGKIDFPDIPDLPGIPGLRTSARGSAAGAGGYGGAGGGGAYIPIIIYAIDPTETGRVLDRTMRRYGVVAHGEVIT